MQKNYFKWDDNSQSVAWAIPLNVVKRRKRKKELESELKSKLYFPYSRLNFKFKDTLNFPEQTKYDKLYQRKPKLSEVSADVVLLQDIKDMSLYLISSPISFQLISFLHLKIVDRFLRALILYMQSFVATWTDLSEKRAATAKLAPNPLAGGARVRRAEEMCAMRWMLAREYADILTACQREAKEYHHMNGGELTFCHSSGEKDIRIHEGLLQFAHRVVWIALERKQKELIEVEIDRLFRTNAFNIAKRKFKDSNIEFDVPDDEHWILYGPKIPEKRKILKNSPLVYEVLYTEGDYRLLSLGLRSQGSNDPRIRYLENAVTAKEEDLSKLGIKLGILGLPRADYDLLLLPQAAEEDQALGDETSEVSDESEEADQYEVLLPSIGSDLELDEPYPKEKVPLKSIGNDSRRTQCKKMWLKREKLRAASIMSVTGSIEFSDDNN